MEHAKFEPLGIARLLSQLKHTTDQSLIHNISTMIQ